MDEGHGNQEFPDRGGVGVREAKQTNKQTGHWGWGGWQKEKEKEKEKKKKKKVASVDNLHQFAMENI